MFAFCIDWWLFSITNKSLHRDTLRLLKYCFDMGQIQIRRLAHIDQHYCHHYCPCFDISTPGPAWEHRPPPCRVHKPCSCCHTSSQVGRSVKGWGLRSAWKRPTHFLECWTCSPQGRHRLDHLGQQRAHTSPACSGDSIVFLTLLWQQARRDISDHISTGSYLLRCFCSNHVLLFDCSLYYDNKQEDKYKNIFWQAKLKILQKKKGGEGGEEMVKVKAEVTNKHSFVHCV